MGFREWGVLDALNAAAGPTVAGVLAAAAIVVGGDLFVTGTEWLVDRFGLSEHVAGSVLSGLGSSLPELLIPIFAVLAGSGETVGVGAVLGGPVTLTTLGPGLLGAAILGRAVRPGAASPSGECGLDVAAADARLDLAVFLAGFALATAAALVPLGTGQIAVAVALVGLYGWYLRRLRQEGGAADVDPDPLQIGHLLERFQSGDREAFATNPPQWLVVGQSAVGLAAVTGGSRLFVGAVEAATLAVGPPSPTVVALLIAPLVSNVVEYVDGVLWLRRGQEPIALQQLTGSLAFYGTVVAALGVATTSWRLGPLAGGTDAVLVGAALLALATGGLLFLWIRRKSTLSPGVLVAFGVLYLLYAAGVVGLAVAG